MGWRSLNPRPDAVRWRRKERNVPKFKTCPHCGSHLDHGESCDCQKEPEANTVKRIVTREDWVKARNFMKAANPGDLVVEEIVDATEQYPD